MSSTEHTYTRDAEYKTYAIDLNKVYYHKIIKAVRKFSNRESGRLLDIGCFDGTLASQFTPAWDVYGAEGDIKAVERAKEQGVKVTLTDLDQKLPFEANFFDSVIAAEIIEHVYDTDAFLQEIMRVLKATGVLVMSIPNTACLTNRVKMLFGGYPRYAEYKAGGAGHIRIYTAKVIKKQLEENGFKVVHFAGCNLPLPMHNPWIPKWIKRIAISLGDYFPTIAGQVILAAVKSR